VSRACLGVTKPLVIGTTGHSGEERALIETTAKSLPVVLSPNFSVGVNALFWLTRAAARMLGEDFDLEIAETHHRLKKDAPSGTAKKLAEILCEVRKLDYATNARHGREGLIGERPAKEIGVHSIRAGDVVGDHTVTFGGQGERLELTHKASSRETFAAGALRAAGWIVGKPPGLYSMEDVLGLSRDPK
jgi:4-hydroxy-tetrahydrodipicolinate reductase